MHYFNCSCSNCLEWKARVAHLANWEKRKYVSALRAMPVPFWLVDEIDRLCDELSKPVAPVAK